jgi:hypothetical protein
MKKLCCIFAILFAVIILPSGARAQMPDSVFAVSKSGQGLFRVNVDGGALFGGSFDGGQSLGIPAEGAGTRMIWYPRKAAFRAGYVNGTQWDDANIGNYSVAMGEGVRASGDYGVAMGRRTVAANGSSFAVGEDNTASGYGSVAMGYHAHTNARRGSFVFGDNVTGGTADTLRAEFAGQALWRLSCGMRIYTNQTLTTGVAFGGPAVNSPVCGSSNPYFAQSNAMISTSTGAYLSTSGTWTNSSDVNRKHNFEAISGEGVLAKLRSVPITSWSYKVDGSSVRHIGPMAQDFRAAFGLGADEVSIATIDADGIALAGVSALDARTQSQGKRIDVLERENAELRKRLERVEALIAATSGKN